MCGIIGYTGARAVPPILLDGLKRLEYRGYDSSGMALAGAGMMAELKEVGKVARLEAALQAESGLREFTGCGIAHTRWATHGVPSTVNAHPHCDGKREFAIVHNGIVENHHELRSHLEKKGYRFRSQTDSEVIVHLIADAYNGDLLAATAAALRQVSGTYGLAVVSVHHPGLIVAARKGSPLVIGLGSGENLIASDIAALLTHTRQVIYLNDGDIAAISPESVDLRDISNVPVEREVANIDWDAAAAEKGNYPHFMLKEIFEQPETIENAIRGRINYEMGTAILNGLGFSPCELAQISRIVIAACGSSMHAGMVAEYYFEDIAGISTSVEQAAEFRYRNPIIEPNTLVIPIRRHDRGGPRSGRQGSLYFGALQRGRFDHRPRGRARRLSARGAGDQRRVDEGVFESGRRASADGAAARAQPAAEPQRRVRAGARDRADAGADPQRAGPGGGDPCDREALRRVRRFLLYRPRLPLPDRA